MRDAVLVCRYGQGGLVRARPLDVWLLGDRVAAAAFRTRGWVLASSYLELIACAEARCWGRVRR